MRDDHVIPSKAVNSTFSNDRECNNGACEEVNTPPTHDRDIFDTHGTTSSAGQNALTAPSQFETNSSSTSSVLPRKRTRHTPTWHRDYDVQLNTVKIFSPPNVCTTTSVDSGNPYPLFHYVKYNHFSVGHRAFLAAIAAHREPTSFQEAVKDPLWREAMQREIQALEQTGTWKLQPLPPGKIGSMR
ncbi:unnamed protein product [Cuscuta epithymum]|uniref:Uncharacterized protein n=1 Tax=Cuscuta epithymum TaxID=186058 RepID=A0AAV0G788_9ASTE|nr:unnamed protein product [Cuscuta epithymum]